MIKWGLKSINHAVLGAIGRITVAATWYISQQNAPSMRCLAQLRGGWLPLFLAGQRIDRAQLGYSCPSRLAVLHDISDIVALERAFF